MNFHSYSYSDTYEFAKSFADTLSNGAILAFEGNLGAGKTCFISGLAKGLGYDGEVSSPTFALVNEYRGGKIDIFHFDMYRINSWNDLYSTGFYDYIDENGVMVIEWSENIASAIPDNAIHIIINRLSDNERLISIYR